MGAIDTLRQFVRDGFNSADASAALAEVEALLQAADDPDLWATGERAYIARATLADRVRRVKGDT